MLLDNTDQLIFLSSYRVYADEEHPIKETSPQLLNVVKDQYFLENENSSRSKLEYQVLLLEALYQHQQNQNLLGFNWRGRRRPDFGVFLRFMEEKGLIKCNSKRYFVIKRGVISSRYFPNTVWLLLGKISNLLLGDSVSVTEKKVRDIVNAIIRRN